MPGDKLYCKQAFQGQCGKISTTYVAASYCRYHCTARETKTNKIYVFSIQGPVHAYVAVPGGRTSYLSELQSGREVIIVDQNGLWRTAIVGRVKIESRPLILVEAKVHN